MKTAKQIEDTYIRFFTNRGHKEITNAPLIPANDPTTLFTSSGMQPLVPYLLGEQHPEGKRLVNVQNSFRAQDIDEIGDNRHTTFFRMLGNWSLGDYFKEEQIPWFFEFLTNKEDGLGLNPDNLYVTVFGGYSGISEDTKSIEIWQNEFKKVGIDAKINERIFIYSVEKNWWSRAGVPDNMPPGEPGGPDTEVFYDYKTEHNKDFGETCHVNCDCGRYVEIGNSVFMQYQKQADGTFKELPQKNVDFGGGLERLLAAVEHKQDVFETNLFSPIIQSIEKITHKSYKNDPRPMRIITDHFIGATFMALNDIKPSNKEQGYIMRRLIRRGLDNFYQLDGQEIDDILTTIVQQYKETDPDLVPNFEKIKLTILQEKTAYEQTLHQAKKTLDKELLKQGIKIGDELMGVVEIPAELAFKALSSYGLSPTQLKSLGYSFNDQALADEIKKHQVLSRKGSEQKFKGGLADHQERTIMGHTATHLLHKALRDMFGEQLHQTGSNITTERLRFDFNFDRKLTDEEIEKLNEVINAKIVENLPVHFEMIPTDEAKKMGAIGLFEDTYANTSKIYFIGDTSTQYSDAYSIEFCGGPHVDFTGVLKNFKIIKQENIGHGQRRLYAQINV